MRILSLVPEVIDRRQRNCIRIPLAAVWIQQCALQTQLPFRVSLTTWPDRIGIERDVPVHSLLSNLQGLPSAASERDQPAVPNRLGPISTERWALEDTKYAASYRRGMSRFVTDSPPIDANSLEGTRHYAPLW
jgi:hypothetical protein